MKSIKALDIYDVAKPFHVCSKLLGLTAFTVRRYKGGYLTTVTICNIFSLILSTILNCAMLEKLCSSYEYKFVEKQNKYIGSNILYNAMFFVSFGFMVISMLTNWWTMFQRKVFAKLLTLLSEVDDELKEMEVKVNLKKHRKVMLSFIFIVKMFLFTGLIMNVLSERKDKVHYKHEHGILFYFALAYFSELIFFDFYHFSFWIWAIKVRYNRINCYLDKKFLRNVTDEVVGKKCLIQASTLHNKLVDASELINRCYAVPVSELN